MNGSGDILIGDISEDRFKKMSPADREWLLLSSIKSLSQTCHKRPLECDKRFIKRDWFKSKLAFISGFGAAISFVGATIILKLLGVI